MGSGVRQAVPTRYPIGMNLVLRLTQIFYLTLPFQVALSPYPGVDLPFSRVFAPVLFLVALSVGLARRRVMVRISGTAFFLTIFLVLSTLSVAWADQSGWAVRRILFLVSYVTLFPVLVGMLGEGNNTQRLLRWVVAGSALSAFVGFCQFAVQYVVGVPAVFRVWTHSVLPVFLGQSFGATVAEYPSLLANIGGITTLRVSAFFPDPHVAAFVFGMTLPFAVSLAAIERPGARRNAALFAAFMLLLADLLTFSRGGYVGVAFGALTFGLRYVSDSGKFGKRIMAASAIVIIACISVFTVSPVRERMLSVFDPSDGSNSARMTIYSEAVTLICRAPFGYGLGNYPLAVKPSASYREPIYAHNLMLDVATETGVIGALAFFGMLLSAFVRSRKAAGPFAGAASVSLAIFFGHSIFETPLYSVHVFPLLLLVLAMSASLSIDVMKGRRRRHSI